MIVPMESMPFGKYRGRWLHEIPSGYLAWVLDCADAAGEDLLEAIEHELRRRHQKHTERVTADAAEARHYTPPAPPADDLRPADRVPAFWPPDPLEVGCTRCPWTGQSSLVLFAADDFLCPACNGTVVWIGPPPDGP